MRKPLMIALIAAGVASGGVAVLATQAIAQGAPPPPPGMDGGPMAGRMPGGPMGHGGPGGMRGPGGMMRRMRQFALIYPTADRNLSGADVQKIAEAFLLFNGNHTWKVTEVKEEPDQVTFTLASPDGGAIAHFAMDRHTGRPTRLS
jgi:hypothetical protein